MKLTTTLTRIRDCHPCADWWRKLLEHVGKDFDPEEEINLLTIIDSNGVTDMLWCLRATVQDSRRVAAELAIAFAERVMPIYEARYPDDQRPRKAIQGARDYMAGKISRKELSDLISANADATAAAANAAAAYAAEAAEAAAAAANAEAAATYAAAAAAAEAASAAEAAANAYAAAAEAKNAELQQQAGIIRAALEN